MDTLFNYRIYQYSPLAQAIMMGDPSCLDLSPYPSIPTRVSDPADLVDGDKNGNEPNSSMSTKGSGQPQSNPGEVSGAPSTVEAKAKVLTPAQRARRDRKNAKKKAKKEQNRAKDKEELNQQNGDAVESGKQDAIPEGQSGIDLPSPGGEPQTLRLSNSNLRKDLVESVRSQQPVQGSEQEHLPPQDQQYVTWRADSSDSGTITRTPPSSVGMDRIQEDVHWWVDGQGPENPQHRVAELVASVKDAQRRSREAAARSSAGEIARREQEEQEQRGRGREREQPVSGTPDSTPGRQQPENPASNAIILKEWVIQFFAWILGYASLILLTQFLPFSFLCSGGEEDHTKGDKDTKDGSCSRSTTTSSDLSGTTLVPSSNGGSLGGSSMADDASQRRKRNQKAKLRKRKKAVEQWAIKQNKEYTKQWVKERRRVEHEQARQRKLEGPKDLDNSSQVRTIGSVDYSEVERDPSSQCNDQEGTS